MSYLLGILAGFVSGLFIDENTAIFNTLSVLVDLSVRIGSYFLLPLIFFSMPVAVFKLRNAGILNKVLTRSLWLSLFSSAVLSVIGTLLAWYIPMERIPVIPGVLEDMPTANPLQMLDRGLFLTSTPFLLPVLILALIIGWHMKFDREASAPTFNLFDSLSRIFYRANYYLMYYIMPALLAILTAHAVVQTRLVVDIQRFLPMLLTLTITIISLVWLICPLMIWIILKDRSPWKTMYKTSKALAGALVSSSPLFNYGNLASSLKENLEIKRRISAAVAPMHLLLSRAGTAMTSACCMLNIIRAYSSLEITLFQASWTMFFSFLVSFLSLTAPHRSITLSLIILGGIYGRGLEEGWLILVPILPILTMLACLLDTAINILMLLIVNRNIKNPDF